MCVYIYKYQKTIIIIINVYKPWLLIYAFGNFIYFFCFKH